MRPSLILKRVNATGVPHRFLLRCAYDERDIAKAAGRGTARWVAKEKAWTYPVDPTVVRYLMDAFADLKIDQSVWDYLAQLREKQERVIASTQLDAPLMPDDSLWGFQRASVRFLEEVGRGILAHQMGLGKTVIVSAAIDYMQLPKGLIVCPNSVKWSWVDHLTTWGKRSDLYVLEPAGRISDPRATVFCGGPDERDDFLADLLTSQRNLILILNYDQVRTHRKVLSSFDYDFIASDEAHRLKNRQAQRTEAMAAIATRTPNLWLLTGTPVRNDLMDWWQLLNLCDPTRFPSYWNFMSLYMETYKDYWTGAPKAVGLRDAKAFNAMLSCYMFRRTKKEVLPDLPNKIYVDHRLPLNPAQQKAYDLMEKDLIALVTHELKGGGPIEDILRAPNAVAQLTRLRQICLSPALIGGAQDSAKLDALPDLFEDLVGNGSRVIVFSNFREFLLLVANVLKQMGIPYGEIVGGQSSTERNAVERALNEGSIGVILGTISSMGEGMNLQAANTAIFCDIDWVPAVNEQAEDRIHRGDVKESPTIIRLYHPNTVEADIRAACNRKERIVESTAGQVEAIRQLLLRQEVIK